MMHVLFKTRAVARVNVLVVTHGPKAGRLFLVPCVPKRKLKLRNAHWLMTNSNREYACGFVEGYRTGVKGFFPEPEE